MYEGTRDQPMPGPFPARTIFKGKALGTRLVLAFFLLYRRFQGQLCKLVGCQAFHYSDDDMWFENKLSFTSAKLTWLLVCHKLYWLSSKHEYLVEHRWSLNNATVHMKSQIDSIHIPIKSHSGKSFHWRWPTKFSFFDSRPVWLSMIMSREPTFSAQYDLCR